MPLLARHTYGRRRVAVLMYHEPAPALLDSHLAYLKRRYTFVTLDEVVDALRARRWNTLSPRGVVVTVDDGKQSNYELLPLFQHYGVVPTLYVCSQLVGTNRRFWFDAHPEYEALKSVPHRQRLARLEEANGFTLTKEYPSPSALSNAEIAELSTAVDIEAHTRFHPVLTTCSDAHCREEIIGCRAEIEALTGRPCRHFCFPNGDYTERELRMVGEAGYRSARTIRTGWIGPHSDPYQLKILGVDDHASVNQLAADLAGLGFIEGFVRRSRPGNLRGRYRPITLD